MEQSKYKKPSLRRIYIKMLSSLHQPYSIATCTINLVLQNLSNQVSRLQQSRLMDMHVSHYSLSQCQQLMQMAVQFGHSFQQPTEQFSTLRSHKPMIFARDAWGGRPNLSNAVVVPRRNSSKAMTMTSHYFPQSMKGIATLKAMKGSEGKFVKLEERVEVEDTVADEMRDRKRRLQELKQEKNDIDTKYETEIESTKGNNTTNGKFTYDFNGKRLMRKDALARKGVAQPPSIDCKESLPKPSTKPTMQKLDARTATNTHQQNSLPTNSPLQSLKAQNIKQFIDSIDFEVGVKIQQYDFGDSKLNKEFNQKKDPEMRLKHENPTPPHNTPNGTMCDVEDIMGLSRIESVGEKSFMGKKRKGEIMISDGWRRDVVRHFRISKKEDLFSTHKPQPPLSTSIPLSPIANYDISILKTQKWGNSTEKAALSTSGFSSKPASVHNDQPRRIRRNIPNASMSSFHFCCM